MHPTFRDAYSRRVTLFISSVLILVCAHQFTRWILNQNHALFPSPDGESMKPLTALLFMMAGAMFIFSVVRKTSTVSLVLAGALTVVPFIIFFQREIHVSEPIDGFIAGLFLPQETSVHVNMATVTAFNFVLCGISFILLRTGRWIRAGHLLIFAVCLIALFTFAQHIYGVNREKNPVDLTGISFLSVLLFLALCYLLVAVRPDEGLMKFVTSNTTAGKFTRVVLLTTLVLPLLVGWVRLQGEIAGLYDGRFGLALMATGNITIISIVILILGWRYYRTEQQQKESQEMIQRQYQLFQALIENSSDSLALQNRDLKIVYRSRSAERITGWTDADRNKLGWQNYIHPDDREAVNHKIQEALAKPAEVIPLSFRTLHRSGDYICLDGTITNLLDNPAVQAIVSNYRDVTAQKFSEEQSRRNENLYRTIAASLPGAVVVVLDRSERYLLAAGEALGALGYDKEGVEGRTAAEVLPPQSYAVLRKHFERVFNGEKFTMDIQSQGKDFYVQYVPLYDHKQQVNAAIVMGIDITAIKTAQRKEQQLAAELQEKLRELADYKYAIDESSIVAITDQKGVIRHVNSNFSRISGYTSEELIGHTHSLINSGYHSTEFIRTLWQTIANGGIWRGEMRNRAKDGTYYWVDTTIVPFLNEQNKPYQYLAIRSDITERRKFAEQLEQANALLKLNGAKLKEAQTIAHVGNWEIDLVRNISTWSDEVFRIFGVQPEDVQPSPEAFMSFIHPEDREYARGITQNALKSLQDSLFYFRLLLHNGQVRYAYSEWKFEFNAEGMPLRMYGIIQDTTERTRAEANLKAVNKELETFIYRAAHDLRGPLSSVMGMVTVGKQEIKDEHALRMFSMIGESAQKLDKTLAGLVQSMYIKDTKLFADKINFGQLFSESIEKYSHAQGFSRMEFNVDISSTRNCISNRVILESVVQNMIENAIKYQNYNRRASLHISVSDNQYEHKLVFADSGTGIHPDHVNQIFDMYFRGVQTTGGSGLGLYIVKTGIEKLRGRIEVKSEYGAGTTFTIYLPS